MRSKPQQAARKLEGATGDAEREELDGLNAQLRGRKQTANLIRRRMEAQIEAKARRKRSSEQPASAALGAGTTKRRTA
ncbi:MAG TPA: hypothetical protein VNT26_04855 [Candidatus Sulfotelmatobacter sp.]|nr:hypothetical protein [Candidatus Sulfotelmatobacter sp.]